MNAASTLDFFVTKVLCHWVSEFFSKEDIKEE